MKNKYTELIIATRNQKKKQEILRLLGPIKIKIWSLSDYPEVPEVVEDGQTFDDNAIKKAVTAATVAGKLVLGEDSGLEVDALDGAPGIYSSRFAGEDASDEINNQKLLRELKGVPFKKRGAQYHCSIAIAEPDGKVKVVRGICRGRIGLAKKGRSGFGYDPLFFIDKYEKTFAELGPHTKDKMSHRAKAMREARRIIYRKVDAVRA